MNRCPACGQDLADAEAGAIQRIRDILDVGARTRAIIRITSMAAGCCYVAVVEHQDHRKEEVVLVLDDKGLVKFFRRTPA